MSLQLLLALLLQNSTDTSGGACNFISSLGQINELKSGTHDFGIIQVTSGLEQPKIDDLTDKILKCLPKENPVSISNDPYKYLAQDSLKTKHSSITFLFADFMGLVRTLGRF
jgi:hypothetical protein